MKFDTIAYMQWAKTQPYNDPALLDFASSGMPYPAKRFDELGIDTSRLPIWGANSYGYAVFREAIAARYRVKPENIFSAHGTSMANFVLLSLLTRNHRAIIIEHPVYECLSAPAESLGLKVLRLERLESEGWRYPLERAKKLAIQKNGGVFLLTNPHNPTGIFTPPEELDSLADSHKDVLVIVDEVYREWLPGEEGKTSALSRPNIIATSSLTKIWGLGPLRAGWMIAEEQWIKDAYRAFDHLSVVHPFAADWLAGEVARSEGLLDRLRMKNLESLEHSRQEVNYFLKKHLGHSIHTVMPIGGGIAFWRFTGMGGDAAAKELLEKFNILVAPGSFFGSPNHVRVGWTKSPENTRQALARLDRWLK